MNKYHQKIWKGIEANSDGEVENFGKKYVGTDKVYYALKTDVSRKIAREFAKENKSMSAEEFGALMESLSLSKSHEEFIMIGFLLQFMPQQRREVKTQDLRNWVSRAKGWAETDVICQMAFTAEDVLLRWSEWSKALREFRGDENVHVRRASLVLLTKPVRLSGDERLAKMSFENIENLKGEKDILITKAVSWLMRSLIKNHKDRVEEYLSQNEASLPRIAVRETRRKLLTGKK